MLIRVLSVGLVGGSLALSGCSKETIESAKKDAGKAADKIEHAAGKAVDATRDAAAKTGEMAAGAAEKGKELVSGLGAEFSSAFDSAKASFEGVEGGPALLTDVQGFFTQASAAVDQAKSSGTAEAAKTKLAELEAQIAPLVTRFKQLPEGAQTAIKQVALKGIASLKGLVEQVKALPAVNDTVKAALDQFLLKAEELAK